MANGTESPNYKECSEIRPGMKREFAMMMKNQSQFIASLGRTRSSKSPKNDAVSPSPTPKKPKITRAQIKKIEEKEKEKEEKLSEEDEAKSGIVDSVNDEEKQSKLGEEEKNLDAKSPKEEGDSGEIVVCEDSLRRITRSVSKSVVVKEEEEVGVKEKEEEKEEEKNVDAKSPSSGEMVVCENSLRRITRSVSKSVVVKEEEEEIAETQLPEKKLPPPPIANVNMKMKELLETGFLEGLLVKYLHGLKARGSSEVGLRGVIKGVGVLCFCHECKGDKVVTPNQFELHAGSSNKRPSEYIYLENGRTILDVLNACKDLPAEAMESTVRWAIGSFSVKMPTYCQNCKVSLLDVGDGKGMLFCSACIVLKEFQPNSPQQSDTSERSPLTTNPKSSDEKAHCNSSKSKGRGRLTRKDLRMHKLGFEALVEGAEVAYFARGKKLLEGYKKGSGIFCFCCNTEVSPSVFEAHAGYAARRKPYLHIYMSNGVSLHEWAVKHSLTREFSAAENDDLCSICADGGDLLLCDTCPRSFHPDCLSMPVVPQGKFHCRYCVNTFEKEKFVERNANAVAAGRVAGVDLIEQINKRCIRIVGTPEADIGGCVLCRGHDFSKSEFGPQTVIICDQCEREYHVGCLKEHNMDDLKELPTEKWFCCKGCNNIHSALENLVADGEVKLSDSLLNVIKMKHVEKGLQECGDLDIRWRLLCGRLASDENRVLLSKAVTIFHEQFDPMADSDTKHLDFIPNMVFGRKSRDQEFGGMYCAVLTANSVVVSAGVFRIFGQEVAELPLVATSNDSQGLGYFQSLFSCIENLLGSLDVKDLVLPAADGAESIWTKKFGFERINVEQLMKYRRDHQMVAFQGTSMLHKPVSST